ncbi:WD domain-containing protein [Colletotrichum scovillei]|uniref:WD domain-containing protein n=1 Tax=Colletotrichum scovillei TaxID=1209932 RepID=A0A9P7RB62_9PEZI|nr:WD domain-containing protein [Colletotrichum scovillei]KAG7080902.1 WD domain-containing protein [Colletotrichum scovillei]
MPITNPGPYPSLENIEYHGIGMSSEVNVLGFCRDGSRSPDGSSISLEPRIEEKSVFSPEVELPKQAFRRSSAPSPESVVGVNGSTARSTHLQHDETVRAARSRPGTPATPEASWSDSLATKTPPTAGPLESYLACPQSHERRALMLPPNNDDERDANSSNCGSVILGRRRVPGVYDQIESSTSPFGTTGGAGDAIPEQPLTHYLSSIHPHEVLAYQMWELASKDNERDPGLELSVPRLSENAVLASNSPISPEVSSHREVDIPAAPAVPSPAVSVPQGPIEVGYERRGSDSAISDLETEELYQLLGERRRAREAGRTRTFQPARAPRGRVEKAKRMRPRRA